MLSGQLLLFDGLETKFRNIKLRARNINCVACGEYPTIQELIDYEQFCGAKANDKEPKLNLLKTTERISVEEYNTILKLGTVVHMLIDVRIPEEYQICHLKNSVNIPLDEIYNNEAITLIKNKIHEMQKEHNQISSKHANVSLKLFKIILRVIKVHITFSFQYILYAEEETTRRRLRNVYKRYSVKVL